MEPSNSLTSNGSFMGRYNDSSGAAILAMLWVVTVGVVPETKAILGLEQALGMWRRKQEWHQT